MLLTNKENKDMRKKKLIKLIPLVLAVTALTACGNAGTEDKSAGSKNTAAQSTASTENAAAASYITPAVENGQLAIDIGTLTEHPLYVNYDSNETNIQMIAVNASDGSARLSLNTCQTCNPSPKAYFKERSGKLVCQNCGNVFKMDSVGGTAGSLQYCGQCFCRKYESGE